MGVEFWNRVQYAATVYHLHVALFNRLGPEKWIEWNIWWNSWCSISKGHFLSRLNLCLVYSQLCRLLIPEQPKTSWKGVIPSGIYRFSSNRIKILSFDRSHVCRISSAALHLFPMLVRQFGPKTSSNVIHCVNGLPVYCFIFLIFI